MLLELGHVTFCQGLPSHLTFLPTGPLTFGLFSFRVSCILACLLACFAIMSPHFDKDFVDAENGAATTRSVKQTFPHLRADAATLPASLDPVSLTSLMHSFTHCFQSALPSYLIVVDNLR